MPEFPFSHGNPFPPIFEGPIANQTIFLASEGLKDKAVVGQFKDDWSDYCKKNKLNRNFKSKIDKLEDKELSWLKSLLCQFRDLPAEETKNR